MPTAELLLIDNSNSFTKFALSTKAQIRGHRKIATRELTSASLQALLRGWKFQRVVMCSVVPKTGAVILKALKKFPVLNIDYRTPIGVGIDYPKPKTIGADRLANAASAAHFYGTPCVVVDFGTAVTFDIISPDRAYIGGVIAPGLEAMTHYLPQRTALLPKIALLEPPGPIGKTTRHAMLSGAVYGYRGLVREIIREIKAALKIKTLRVVATGGYAGLIAAKVPEIDGVHPNLTLEGLRIIAGLQR